MTGSRGEVICMLATRLLTPNPIDIAPHHTILSVAVNEACHGFACITVSKIGADQMDSIWCSQYSENTNYEGF